MKILVVNSGSSSVKYQLFSMPNEQPVCSGLIDRIGLEQSTITHRVLANGEEDVYTASLHLADHEAGLKEVAKLLTDKEKGVITAPEQIEVVGHRVVHGGKAFAATTIIDDAVKATIKSLFQLAPLHNPANYLGIEVAEKIFTRATQVAVFDTAFHQTMPAEAYLYAVPFSLHDEHDIRAYGFHGTSHKYVSEQAVIYLDNPAAKLITIHLGNGCSMAAINAGKCVDTSMGFGPLSGLIMGTRCGDIDPSILFHLTSQMGYSLDEVSTLLNKKSGMLGLTGMSDMRDVGKAIASGDDKAALAIKMYAYRVKKYIGSYTAVLNGLDAIIFTAGVGENDAATREKICSNLNYLGITIDQEENRQSSKHLREINLPGARVKVLVIPTNEELEISKQCYQLLS